MSFLLNIKIANSLDNKFLMNLLSEQLFYTFNFRLAENRFTQLAAVRDIVTSCGLKFTKIHDREPMDNKYLRTKFPKGSKICK